MPKTSDGALFSLERAPRTGPASATVVMLHGYGAHEADLISLGAELAPGLHSIGLRAPIALPWGGHAWYPLVPRDGGIDADQGEVDAAVAQAIITVEAIAKKDGRAPILLGFSQGGGVALAIALQRPELARAVFSLSAAPSRIASSKLSPREALKKLPIFAAHGTRDDVLPIIVGRQTRAFLEETGVKLDWHEYPMGHEISHQELLDMRAFLNGLG
jgi:phospholipase/carboxylesterase